MTLTLGKYCAACDLKRHAVLCFSIDCLGQDNVLTEI